VTYATAMPFLRHNNLIGGGVDSTTDFQPVLDR